MMIPQITIAVVALLSYTCSAGPGEIEDNGFDEFKGGSNDVSSKGYAGGAGKKYPPRSYQFDYKVKDKKGNSHFHKEERDKSGVVRGSYGYTDNEGVYRIVEYIADHLGYRANVTTNEPGMDGKENPADVIVVAEDPPAGIQERYTSHGDKGSADGGAAGSSLISPRSLNYGDGTESGFDGFTLRGDES